MKWVRVTKASRCPICKHPDWCTFSEMGICCMRVQSPRPLKNGGWLHQHGDKPQIPKREQPPDVLIDAERMIEDWSAHTPTSAIKTFSESIGVTYESLASLNCCWSSSHKAWAFPMRSGSSQIIGIRLRYQDGTKRAVKGSRNGLFIPMTATRNPLLLCEGPTDTAAALSLGFSAIGRPSCSGGVAQLYHAVRERKIMRVVIIADNDQDKIRPDGNTYNPGLDGAKRLAEELGVAACLLVPPAKDIREFVTFGGTKPLVDSMIESLTWHQPKPTSPPQQRGTFCTERENFCQEDSPFS